MNQNFSNSQEPNWPLCTSCGCTWPEFLQRGFLGCPDCYLELSETLLPTIQVRTGKPIHTELLPHKGELWEKEALQKELAVLLKLEKYTEAARLTRLLESKLSHPPQEPKYPSPSADTPDIKGA